LILIFFLQGTSMTAKLVTNLNKAIASLQQALNDQLTQRLVTADAESGQSISDIIESTPADISARYWLMTLMEPLSRKDVKSVVDGFLVQMLNEEQAKKLVKFLLIRFPDYYKDIIPSGQLAAQEPPAAPAQPAVAPAEPAPAPAEPSTITKETSVEITNP